MELSEFKNPSGKLLPIRMHDGEYHAFIPDKLPAKLSYDEELVRLLAEANFWLDKLDGAGAEVNTILKENANLFIKPQLENEAAASSKIEGTLSDLDDVLKEQAGQEIADEQKRGDMRELMNYITAQNKGIALIKEQKPISLQLITDLHSILLHKTRGENANPGTIRAVQNFISHYKNAPSIEYSTYVPPPPEMIKELLENLFDYMEKSPEPLIVKIAIMHYQFEAIHPFLNGNGRIGRLLIILYLVRGKALYLPLLYMSDYFEKNRVAYYMHLLDVSKNSTYSDWLKFFLTGVVYQSKIVIGKISKLSEYYKEKGDALEKYSKPTYVLFQQLFASYFITIQRASFLIKVTYPTAKMAVENLVKEGILEPVGQGKTRNQLFVARSIRGIYKT